MALGVESAALLPQQKGTYAVILEAPEDSQVFAGRLGQLQLIAGYYVYVGSAFGPGGLRARLKHHLGASTKPHWHLDYIRPYTTVTGVWFTLDPETREHQWASAISSIRGIRLLFPKFGSSDCNCPTHLWYRPGAPTYRSFRAHLNQNVGRHKKIYQLSCT